MSFTSLVNNCFCLVAILLSLGLTTWPINTCEQTRQITPYRAREEIKPGNCENNIAVIEAAHKATGKDGLLIIIARLGDGERRKALNYRRLHNASAYLTDYLNVRSSETVVIGEGERINGYGRIELYVGGKLFDVLAVGRNADLIVGSCEPEVLDDQRQKELRMKLYPWLKTK